MPASKAQQTLVAERRRAAVQLRIAGHSWYEIAQQLGYDSKASAYTDVRRALEKAVRDLSIPLEVHRELMLQRLDAMLNALWPNVLAGDTKAIDAAGRLLDRYMRLLGLEAPQRHELTLEVLDAALVEVEQQLALARSEAAAASEDPAGEA